MTARRMSGFLVRYIGSRSIRLLESVCFLMPDTSSHIDLVLIHHGSICQLASSNVSQSWQSSNNSNDPNFFCRLNVRQALNTNTVLSTVDELAFRSIRLDHSSSVSGGGGNPSGTPVSSTFWCDFHISSD